MDIARLVFLIAFVLMGVGLAASFFGIISVRPIKWSSFSEFLMHYAMLGCILAALLVVSFAVVVTWKG